MFDYSVGAQYFLKDFVRFEELPPFEPAEPVSDLLDPPREAKPPPNFFPNPSAIFESEIRFCVSSNRFQYAILWSSEAFTVPVILCRRSDVA